VKQYSPGTIINAQIPFFIRRNVSLFRWIADYYLDRKREKEFFSLLNVKFV
jgi:hypothetical protein